MLDVSPVMGLDAAQGVRCVLLMDGCSDTRHQS